MTFLIICHMGFFIWIREDWASLVAQTVKNHLQCGRPRFSPCVGKILWRSIYPFKYSCLANPHGLRSLAGYSPWGCRESDTTEQLSTAQHPFQYSCQENSITEEPGGLQSMGSQKVRQNWVTEYTHTHVCVCNSIFNFLRNYHIVFLYNWHITLYCFKYITWISQYTHCKMIIKISLANFRHHTSLQIFFLMMRTFRSVLLAAVRYVVQYYPIQSPCCTLHLYACVLSHSIGSDSLWPMDCSPPGSAVHGDSPGKNTEVGCHALLQGIFPTQGLNPGLPHCRWILNHWTTREIPWLVFNTHFSSLSLRHAFETEWQWPTLG